MSLNSKWWPFLGLRRYDRLLETCSIALVGKYTKFSDSYASVIKALEHSALAINHKLEIKVCFFLLASVGSLHLKLQAAVDKVQIIRRKNQPILNLIQISLETSPKRISLLVPA